MAQQFLTQVEEQNPEFLRERSLSRDPKATSPWVERSCASGSLGTKSSGPASSCSLLWEGLTVTEVTHSSAESTWPHIRCTPGHPRSPHEPSLPAQLAVFYFQVFLSYTVAGSSFVFGDTLVADVFAFQVNSTLGAKGVGGRCQGCGCGSVGAVQQAAQPGSRCGPRAWEGLSHTPAE